MLTDLIIRNFAIIEELHLELVPGFIVLTGETGAGKSIILDAMALLLGDRADTDMIRSGYDVAYVEATFNLRRRHQDVITELLYREGLDQEDANVLVVAREIRANGRNICRVNGRAVTLNLLKELVDQLVDIHGQGEHLSLLRPRSHQPLLDAFGNLDDLCGEVTGIYTDLQKIRKELASLRQNERDRAQRADLLRFQIEEIDAARLTVGEEDELREERTRIANVEHLVEHVNASLELFGDMTEDGVSITDLLNQLEKEVSRLAVLDETIQPLLERLQGLIYQLTDISGELRVYNENLDFEPQRLDFIEERIELIGRLKRKYGDNIQAILTRREAAADELATIDQGEVRLDKLTLEEERLLKEFGSKAKALSIKRKEAAIRLSEIVEKELADLGMEKARFSVDIVDEPSDHGVYIDQQRLAFDRTGIDQVEFRVSANPGEELKPLAKVASGGETSRLMLALKTALARVDETPTLIFDEIDQGIGGRVGDVVGRKLWGLTGLAGHQVIVVTHLPQLAGYADGHFHVSKRVESGRTKTLINRLDESGRIFELAAMLGTRKEHATGGAESILQQVAQVKTGSV